MNEIVAFDSIPDTIVTVIDDIIGRASAAWMLKHGSSETTKTAQAAK